jgi:hypothetical protein
MIRSVLALVIEVLNIDVGWHCCTVLLKRGTVCHAIWQVFKQGVRICYIDTLPDWRSSCVFEGPAPSRIVLKKELCIHTISYCRLLRVYKGYQMKLELQNTGSAAAWPPHHLLSHSSILPPPSFHYAFSPARKNSSRLAKIVLFTFPCLCFTKPA